MSKSTALLASAPDFYFRFKPMRGELIGQKNAQRMITGHSFTTKPNSTSELQTRQLATLFDATSTTKLNRLKNERTT